MPDPHLNIFYSYDRDMCEDNMTRALMVTLKTISSSAKKSILVQLLKNQIDTEFLQGAEHIEFALQGNMSMKDQKRISKVPYRYLISLTGHNIITEEHKFCAQEQDGESEDLSRVRPDAWIYDGSKQARYCFLIECKTVEADLRASQLIAYGRRFFGITRNSEVDQRTIKLTWAEVVDVCQDVISCGAASNRQEESIIRHLIEYLGFSGVVPFRGLPLAEIPELPAISMLVQVAGPIRTNSLGLKKIPEVPDLALQL